MDYEKILWLKKGKEVITINSKQIILQKIFPAHKLYGADEITTIIISTSDLKRVYYSRYIPFRNSLPTKSKGNLHFQDHKQKYSFAINLNQQECTPIIRLIKQKIPNIETYI